MSAIREQQYDRVFDAQCHFRLLLDSMARPGQIREFPGLRLTPPPPFSPAAAATALALLDTNVSYSCVGYGEAAARYLRVNTSSRESSIDEADFVFLAPGAASPAIVSRAKAGVLAYPEQGATLVFETAGIFEIEALDASTGLNSHHGNATGRGLRLTLSGPGVEGRIAIHVQGLAPEPLEAVRQLNREYPLGVEMILVAGNRFVSIPRSAAAAWD